MTDRLYPEQGEAVVTVLRALGVKVVHPPGLHCCGLPANNSGDDRHARVMAKQTLAVLDCADVDYVVSGSASCVAMIVQDYAHLLRDEPDWAERAVGLADKVLDFTTFLDRVAALSAGRLLSRTSVQAPVTYHDSCQGLNALGLREEPRKLLRNILGYDLRELPENSHCCGFGGSFSFDYPGVAERLMNRKLDNAASTGAPIIVTDNQGCIMHLRGGCDATGRPLRVVHLAELLAERIRDLFGPQMP